jgi:periplasmic protein TonB
MKLFETAAFDSKPWFLSLIDQIRDTWQSYTKPAAPLEITAPPVDVPDLWSEHRVVVPRLLSVLAHVTMVTLALIPWATSPKQLPQGLINVALYAPSRLILPPDAMAGGGGGGRHELQQASLGKLPKAADRQLTPPNPEPPKNLDPTLIVEQSIVAPQLASLPPLQLLNIGDPNGVSGPLSSGPGNGDGIGPGSGHGVGPGEGPGYDDGAGGGHGDNVFIVGAGVSQPVLIHEVRPDYSEEARKARYQGTVVLDTVVLEDGSVQVIRIARALGFGLDQKAIAAVLQWRFRPALKNGKPVPVALNVEVNFNLR